MKTKYQRLLNLFLCLLLVLPAQNWAYAGDPVDEFNAGEQVDAAQEYVVEAPVEVEITPTNNEEVDLVEVNNEIVFVVGPPELSDAERKDYISLTDTEKDRFHSTRYHHLKLLAQALSINKISTGFIVALKNKIFRKKATEEAQALPYQAKSTILNKFNTYIWRQAGKFSIDFSKRGFSFVVGYKVQLGVLRLSLGDARFFAFDIGYDHERKSLVVRVDKQKEAFDMGGAVDAFFVFKFFKYTKKSHLPEEVEGMTVKLEEGESYYPPSPVPFVGYGVENSRTRISQGFYCSLGLDICPWGFTKNIYKKETLKVKEFNLIPQVATSILKKSREIIDSVKKFSLSNVFHSKKCVEILKTTEETKL